MTHGIFGFNEAVEEIAELVTFASIDGVTRVRQHPNAEKPLPRFAKVMKVDSMTSSRSQHVMSGYSLKSRSVSCMQKCASSRAWTSQQSETSARWIMWKSIPSQIRVGRFAYEVLKNSGLQNMTSVAGEVNGRLRISHELSNQ